MRIAALVTLIALPLAACQTAGPGTSLELPPPPAVAYPAPEPIPMEVETDIAAELVKRDACTVRTETGCSSGAVTVRGLP